MEDYILDKPFINGCNTEKLRLLSDRRDAGQCESIYHTKKHAKK